LGLGGAGFEGEIAVAIRANSQWETAKKNTSKLRARRVQMQD
jgi:hypothetical protein